MIFPSNKESLPQNFPYLKERFIKLKNMKCLSTVWIRDKAPLIRLLHRLV